MGTDKRLNPFAFPAETDLRFDLLVVAAVLLAVDLGRYIPLLINPEWQNVPTDFQFPEPGNDLFFQQYQTTFLKLASVVLPDLAFSVALAFAIFVLAALLYRAHPLRLRRRRGLQPLSPEGDPAFSAEIQRLASLAGLASPPSVELGKGLQGRSGQAFGFRPPYSLRLDGGLRLLLRKAPPAFQAIVLHELAHIANRDIGRTYFAQALWTAMILLTLAPLTLALGAGFVRDFFLKLLAGGPAALDLRHLLTVVLPAGWFFYLQVLATLAVVAAIRASLLRAREVYADWRAASWGAEEPLSAILLQSSVGSHQFPWCGNGIFSRQSPVFRLPSAVWSLLSAVFRLHPAPAERLADLQNPLRLFFASPGLAFVVGLLLAFTFGGLFSLSFGLLLAVLSGPLALASALESITAANPGSPFAQPVMLLSRLVLLAILPLGTAFVSVSILGMAYLIAGSVGLQVQREAVAELVQDRPGFGGYLRLWLLAGLIALGTEAGFLLAPFAQFAPRNWGSAALILPWLLAGLILTGLSLVYARFFARRLLGSHAGASPPHSKLRLLTAALTGLLGLFYLPLLSARLFISSVRPGGPGPTDRAFLGGFLLITLLMVFIVFPLICGLTWMLIRVWQSLRPPRCPACRRVSRQPVAAGHRCEHCGQDLAPWLFADR